MSVELAGRVRVAVDDGHLVETLPDATRLRLRPSRSSPRASRCRAAGVGDADLVLSPAAPLARRRLALLTGPAIAAARTATAETCQQPCVLIDPCVMRSSSMGRPAQHRGSAAGRVTLGSRSCDVVGRCTSCRVPPRSGLVDGARDAPCMLVDRPPRTAPASARRPRLDARVMTGGIAPRSVSSSRDAHLDGVDDGDGGDRRAGPDGRVQAIDVDQRVAGRRAQVDDQVRLVEQPACRPPGPGSAGHRLGDRGDRDDPQAAPACAPRAISTGHRRQAARPRRSSSRPAART